MNLIFILAFYVFYRAVRKWSCLNLEQFDNTFLSFLYACKLDEPSTTVFSWSDVRPVTSSYRYARFSETTLDYTERRKEKITSTSVTSNFSFSYPILEPAESCEWGGNCRQLRPMYEVHYNCFCAVPDGNLWLGKFKAWRIALAVAVQQLKGELESNKPPS